MTIKSKLTLNVIIVLSIVAAVSATSIIGMGFVKRKLFYLTEQSTPYQMRTVEFQKAIQEVTAGLIKVSVSKNAAEYDAYRKEAEAALNGVKNAQAALETLSGNTTMSTYKEMHEIASEIFDMTHNRLQAEDEAETAKKTIIQKLKESSIKLNELDKKIRSLQLNRSAAFIVSMDNAKDITEKLKPAQSLQSSVKDLQVAAASAAVAGERKVLTVIENRINVIIDRILKNAHLKESKNASASLKTTTEKVKELVRLKASLSENANENIIKEFNELNKETGERLTGDMAVIEHDINSIMETFKTEFEKQQSNLVQVNIANNVLGGNSDLISQGITIDSLTARLFISSTDKEINSIKQELEKIFEVMDSVKKNLEKSLKKLKAEEELKMLLQAEHVVNSTKGLLLARDGIVAKLRHKMNMQENALEATEKLKNIVVKQAEKGRETVTIAQEEQEKAIGTVNKMVNYSTALLGFISIGVVVFGIVFGMWVYRSIAKPLTQLIHTSDEVSHGNLKDELLVDSNDEIGTVQSSMSKMVSNLREIVEKMRAATSGLASSSEELSATASLLDKNSREQSLQVEQSATAMTQMSQTILDVAKNAADTSKTAHAMQETAILGKEEMDATLNDLTKFVETIKESAVKIESLGQKSTEVTNVVTLIKDIADQTNLLALNAAIEAARAGEQGRGFAVVADNVRQLAERTTQATNDITSTIKTMEKEIKDSVKAMKEERSYAENVLNSVKNALQSIDKIVAYVGGVTDMVQRIAATTEEQTATSDTVSNNMEHISGVTRHLSNSVAEIKRSSDDLSKLATDLNLMAEWFKV
ncbi:MAG: methyl-accepting chemotaxis protein [Nitrospiraceae bacterium]|nr:MAG: methyl-accepting chemotaxis protein [Nitrospiraceae bacterium]